ncbi:hypothetical protein [uncultured Tyzzerella sp.]|uniref:hypothetical protein n=1 Tax=uncultured Tyzzerella sp. TaxID=2321398 RepID=UPI0029429BC6|nr:hypothetical protein [uncultured Tyzzerella sp.]
MLKNNKGYILIEVAIFIIIISMLCVSLTMIIGNKISINNRDRIDTNLYLTAKSTINVLEDYFENDKLLLKKYSKDNEVGNFFIKEREDIDNIIVSFYEQDSKTALIKVTVIDNLKNEITLTAKIPY